MLCAAEELFWVDRMLPGNGQHTVVPGLQPEVVVTYLSRREPRVLVAMSLVSAKKMEQKKVCYPD